MTIRPRRIALTFILALSATLSTSANVAESTVSAFSPSADRAAPRLSLATALREQPSPTPRVVYAPILIEEPFTPSQIERLPQLRAQRAVAAVVEAKANQPQFIAKPKPKPAPTSTNYVGVNHLWVPALGISANWGFYGCAAGSENGLPNGLFIWTCSGPNNTYFVSHNTSTFKPLRAAYLAGRLQPGMIAITGDAQGTIHRWRLTSAVDMEKVHEIYDRWSEVGGWSSAPVLTMQTCWDLTPSTRFIIVRWEMIN